MSVALGVCAPLLTRQYYTKSTQRRYDTMQGNKRRASLRSLTRDVNKINNEFYD